MIEGPAFYPYLSGRDNLAVVARYAGRAGHAHRSRAGDRSTSAAAAATSSRLLARHEAAARRRRRPAQGPRPRRARRAHQRPRPAGMRDMRALIRRLGDEGHTVILSSHMLGEVQQVCDRVGVINRGRMIVESTVDELRGEGELGDTASPSDVAARRSRRWAYVQGVRTVDDELRLRVDERLTADVTRALVLAGVESRRYAGSTGSSRTCSSRSPRTSTRRRPVMSEVIDVTRAELFKLVRRPAAWTLLAARRGAQPGVRLPDPVPVLRRRRSGRWRAPRAIILASTLPDQLVANTLGGFPVFAGALALVFGALVFGSEYGWGTVKTLLTQRPGAAAVLGGQFRHGRRGLRGRASCCSLSSAVSSTRSPWVRARRRTGQPSPALLRVSAPASRSC